MGSCWNSPGLNGSQGTSGPHDTVTGLGNDKPPALPPDCRHTDRQM